MFNLLIGRALLRWALKLGEDSDHLVEARKPHIEGPGVDPALTSSTGEGVSKDDDLWTCPRIQRPAMGSLFEIYLAGQDRNALVAAGEEALDQIERLDRQLSHYRDDSDIARLNLHARDNWVRLEPRLYQLLRRCRSIWESTDGAFDITTGALTKAWGFYDGEKRVPYDNEINAVLQRAGMDKVLFDDEDDLVHFSTDNLEVNLGAIGKGFAIDEAADVLRMWGVENAVTHGGQSTIYAMGDAPPEQMAIDDDEDDSGGWPFTIRDPRDHSTAIRTVRLKNQALSTSGSYEDFFEVDGRRFCHILDPRTGRPTEGMLSVSVVASTAEESDALSTAFFVMGREATEQFCQSRSDLQVVMIEETAGSATISEFGFEPR